MYDDLANRKAIEMTEKKYPPLPHSKNNTPHPLDFPTNSSASPANKHYPQSSQTDEKDWYQALKDGAKKEQDERARRFSDGMQTLRERTLARQQKEQNLFYKALEKSYRDDKTKMEREREQAKQKAIDKVEEDFERKHGIYSDKTKNKYKNLLNGIAKQFNKK